MSQMERKFDTVIVGQGLAGSALAWALEESGDRLLLIDGGDPSSSSRIAAGLMTPITGQRLTRYPAWNEFAPYAFSFYRSLEERLGISFLSEMPAVRVFASVEERQLFVNKYAEADDVRLLEERDLPDCLTAPWGGFEMQSAARINTECYLSATREWFEEREAFTISELILPDDLDLHSEHIQISRFGVSCQQIVFCQGFTGSTNPWFRDVPFDSAKGEILKVNTPQSPFDGVVHNGIWMTPDGDGVLRIGATYDRDHLDRIPTLAGQTELLTQFQTCCPELQELEVFAHRAAVRPVIHGRTPRVGLHPRDSRLGFFNGLGSRGALLAPLLGQRMADLMRLGTSVDLQYDLHQKVDLSECFV